MPHKLSISVKAATGKTAAMVLQKAARHLLAVSTDEYKDGIQIPLDFTKKEDHACGSFIVLHDTGHEDVESANLLLGLKSAEEQARCSTDFVRLVAVDVGTVKINGKDFVCCVVLRNPEIMKAPATESKA